MLKIKTYLDRSAVHGIGLFAGDDIGRGTTIWEYHPGVDLSFSRERWLELLNTLAPAARDTIRRQSYKERELFHLCLDHAQFMNHSRERGNVGNDRRHNTMFALLPIGKGEELLCDYFEFSDPDDYHLAFLG
ncbi:MAG: SET domain-containing protein-lysine N-methyltransferase [Desulfurivibrionaceae bacterium]